MTSGRILVMISIIVGLIAIISFAVSVDRGAAAMERGIAANKTAVGQEKKRNDDQDEIMATILELSQQQAIQVDSIYKRGLIIQGRALVLDTGDEPYVGLNTWDPAGPVRLAEFETLKIINLNVDGGLVTVEIKVGPSFTNTTPDYVIQLSKAAGELLQARPGTWITVRAKPVFGEK